MFVNGGMILFNLAGAALVLAVSRSDTRGPAKWFSNPVLVWWGERSYGLYIWHWPIFLILRDQFPSQSMELRLLAAYFLTVTIAGLSYKFLEYPVMRVGFKRLNFGKLPGALSAAVAFSLIAMVAINMATTRLPDGKPVDFYVPPLVESDGEYVAGDGRVRVGLLGDSVAQGVVNLQPPGSYSDLEIIDLAVPGCDFSQWTPAAFNEAPIASDADCLALVNDLEATVAGNDIDVVVMMGMQSGSLPHFDNDGKMWMASDPEYLRVLDEELSALRSKALDGGADVFAVTTVPCRFGLDLPEIGLPELTLKFAAEYPEESRKFADPREFNDWLRAWAERNESPVLDLYSALGCDAGFSEAIHGYPIFADFLHFSPEGAAMVWSWLAPRVRELSTGTGNDES